MLSRLGISSGAALCSLVGCFNPASPAEVMEADTDPEPTTGSVTTDDAATTSVSTTTEPMQSSGDLSTGSTGADVCGDGEVSGDELCDDGVNDGSYGSCTADCGARAEHCGDATINGPELCDDGVNDDGYGGCSSDCSAIGPHCGDGIVQNGQEMCDDGEANANGMGCNVDCVASGTALYEYASDPLEHCGEPTPPVFRTNDNALIALGGCGTWILLELSPELEEVESTPALLAGHPHRAAMRGEDWLLADWQCNWIVADDGTVTEICDDTRNTGADSIEAVDDERYIAMKNGEVALFGAESPASGDTPQWVGLGNADDPGNWYHDTWRATMGALGSVVTSGQYSYSTGSEWIHSAYVERFSSSGVFLNSRTYSEMTSFHEIHSDPDGTIFLSGWDDDSPTNLMRLNTNLNVTWSMQACTHYVTTFVVDNAGHLVIECEDEFFDRYLLKLDGDGNELWTVDLEFEFDPTMGRLAIDANDNIVRAAMEHNALRSTNHLRVEKFAP